MQFNLGCKVGARFKLIARKASDNTIARESQWFNNIVLDSGLAQMSKGSYLNYCYVGSGNSVPDVKQTTLDHIIGKTSRIQSQNSARQTVDSPYYVYSQITWRFEQGVAAGNISEIGLGWENNQLWNRALVKDENGHPTTITLLSDEYLDVVSEIRCYFDEKIQGSFNLLNKFGSIISSHTYKGFACLADGGTLYIPSKLQIGRLQLFSGEIRDIKLYPNGSSFLTLKQNNTTYPTPTSTSSTFNLDLDDANNFVHQSFVVMISGLWNSNAFNGYQIQIDPPIQKNKTQTMSYTFSFSWGRLDVT